MESSATKIEEVSHPSSDLGVAKDSPDNSDYSARITDLEEKLQTLIIKRAEDKAKLKEMEKLRIQNQQLNEFKKQILESQAELQKQYSQAKKEAEEAVEEKLRHADEMKDLAETAEIATLDKEMAEEKYEQLSREYESLKEKLDEVSVDFELLKSEVELKGGEGVANNYELKQLQQQNARYNEAILKLRDLSAADKLEIQKLIKLLEATKKEVAKLAEIKSKIELQNKELQESVCELKEQLDIGLGSQEMVEILTEKNLQLEDKVATLQEEIDDLEKITEINEQLQEGARESELELREELDISRSKISGLAKKLEESQEFIANLEGTIQKFRDLVKTLREENEDLQSQFYLSQEQSQEKKVENIEFKMRFAETKAFARNIEISLRRIEVNQYRKEIELLSKFLPQSFFAEGSDNDAIQVILFVSRMNEKCDIIARQIQEKYQLIEIDALPLIDGESIIRKTNETFRQQQFTRKLLFLLSTIQTILSQYTDSLKACSIDFYLKIASLYSELKTHEKTIDFYLDLLKKDQLDETVPLDNIEKALNYFASLYNLHLADNKVSDCRELLSHFVTIMKAGVDVINFSILSVKKCINSSAEGIDRIDIIDTYLGDIQEFSKKIRRRLLTDESAFDLTVIIENEIRDCVFQMNKAVSAMNTIEYLILEAAFSKSSEELFLFKNLQEIDAIITQTGGFKFLEVSLNGIMSVCSQLSTGLQQGDFDGGIKRVGGEGQAEQPSDPLALRAKFMIDQSDKLAEYKTKLEAKESDINDLKKALKLKISESSEMQIRKDIAEKKLLSATKNGDERATKLQSELDEIREIMRKKEKEYEDTLNHFQADIETLESDRNDLKEKVKLLNKRTVYEGLTKSMISPNSSQRLDVTSSSSLTPLENSYMQQLGALRNALRIVKNENINLKCKLEERRLKIDNVGYLRKKSEGKPWWYGKIKDKQFASLLDDVPGDKQEDEELNAAYVKQQNLLTELKKFKNQYKLNLINQPMFSPNKPFRDQLIEDKIQRRKQVEEFGTLSEKVNSFYIQQKSLCIF